MPLTIDDYDINKVSFIAAPKKDNLYFITYNYIKANIITDELVLDGNTVKIKEDYRSQTKKLFFKKSNNDLYDDEDNSDNEQHKLNLTKLVNLADKLKKSLNDDYIKKSYNNKTPTIDSYYELVLSIRTNASGISHGLINFNESNFNISFEDLKYLLAKKLKCKIKVCPEYFYIGKNRNGQDDFRLGLTIKSIIVDNDQLEKFPLNLYTIIKYNADQDKINDIKVLKDIYTKPVRPSYKSKKDIVSAIIENN